MLLTLKEDNTNGNPCLFCSLFELTVIIKLGEICTSVHLCIIFIYTNGVMLYTCPCMLLASTCAI